MFFLKINPGRLRSEDSISCFHGFDMWKISTILTLKIIRGCHVHDGPIDAAFAWGLCFAKWIYGSKQGKKDLGRFFSCICIFSTFLINLSILPGVIGHFLHPRFNWSFSSGKICDHGKEYCRRPGSLSKLFDRNRISGKFTCLERRLAGGDCW